MLTTLLLWILFAVSQQPSTPVFGTAATGQSFEANTTVESDSLLKSEFEQRISANNPAAEKIYVQIDRTMFKPGDTVWFAAYLRNAGSLLPSSISEILYVELVHPNGSTLITKKLEALDGIGAGEFDLNAAWPGGQYTLRAYTNWMRNTDSKFERTITVQKTVLPNINAKLEFERKSYGVGEIAVAKLDLTGLDNQVIANRTVHFVATSEDWKSAPDSAKTDAQGRAYIRVTLPQALATPDVLLNVKIPHRGATESISRAVPVVLNKIDLQFFPEGGDAVAGLPCRMAFKAINEFGKPADVAGVIEDEQGRQVATFSSYHDGMGAVDFIPANVVYSARLTQPFQSTQPYMLPPIKKEGMTLRVQEQTSDHITVFIAGNRPDKAYLTATSKEDKVLFIKTIQVSPNQNIGISIPINNMPTGIVRLTLFDKNKNEVAERLVFTGQEKGLQVDITTDQEKYLPRERVRMGIQVKDGVGKPVQGQFSLAVCDDKLLTFADDKQGHILASLLLEQDVKGIIEEPNFYFDPKEPKSTQALDFLLMTQGWRRFNWNEPLRANVPTQFQAEKMGFGGTIRDEAGQPVANLSVQLYPNGRLTKTDKNGYFSFKGQDVPQYRGILFGTVVHSVQQFGYNLAFTFHPPSKIPRTEADDYTIQYAEVQNSKEEGSVHVTVMDKESMEPLFSVTAVVMNGPQMGKGAITNIDGIAVLELQEGNHDLSVTFYGYKSCNIANLQVKKGTKANIVVRLHPSENMLEEVVVVSEKLKIMKKEQAVSSSVEAPVKNKKNKKADKPGQQEPRKDVAQKREDEIPQDIEAGNVAKPVIEQDKTVSGTTLATDEVKTLPQRSVNAIVAPTKAIYPELDRSQALIGVVDPNFGKQQPSKKSRDKLRQEKKAEKDDAPNAYDYQDGDELSEVQYRYGLSSLVTDFHRARTFYTPKYTSTNASNERNDFRPTIYWNPAVKTDQNGWAEVEFYTSDAITNFRTTLEGISASGTPGRAEQRFFVQKPLDIAVKTPPYVIEGDTLQLEILVNNHTKSILTRDFSCTVPSHFQAIHALPTQVEVPAGGTTSILAAFLVGPVQAQSAETTVQIEVKDADAMVADIPTLDRGFPVRQVFSENAAQASFRVNISDPVAGTLAAQLNAYPSTLNDITAGMERMLNQPSGCFEQVSSSNYPNLLVLKLLRQTGQSNPQLEASAMRYLEDGYKKLVAYECKGGGFDWWGRDPGHEGLTAYGLLQFKDMSKVMEVDPKVISRTTQWLLSRRDGKGGWQKRTDHLHSWNSSILGAYVAWAVAEAGSADQFMPEINSAYTEALQSEDPYQIALLANALLLMKDNRAEGLVQHLLKSQSPEGTWTGKTQSITASQGSALTIETTALATMALLKTGQHPLPITKAIEFIGRSKNEFGYGNTQSTVLALRALVEFCISTSQSAKEGTLVVAVNGKRVAAEPFSTKNPQPIHIEGLEQYLQGGTSNVEVYFEGTDKYIPFDLEVKYATRTPLNRKNIPLSFQTKLMDQHTTTGSTVRLQTTLTNTGADYLPSPMVILGIPAGLSLQPWQLKQLQTEHKCDYYEIWDGCVVFHFEGLNPGETRMLPLDLRADIAGTFEAPASRAYLYYNNEQRVWAKPERLFVAK